jgi:hypothetical protein
VIALAEAEGAKAAPILFSEQTEKETKMACKDSVANEIDFEKQLPRLCKPSSTPHPEHTAHHGWPSALVHNSVSNSLEQTLSLKGSLKQTQ